MTVAGDRRRSWELTPTPADDLDHERIARAKRELPDDWPARPSSPSWPTSDWQLDAACSFITPELSAQMVNASAPADLCGPCERCPVRTRCLRAGVESFSSGVWGGEVLLDGLRAVEPLPSVNAELLALLSEQPRDRAYLHRRLGRESVAAALVAMGDAVEVAGEIVRLAVAPVEVAGHPGAEGQAVEVGRVVQRRPVAGRRNERRDLARVARRAARRSRRRVRT